MNKLQILSKDVINVGGYLYPLIIPSEFTNGTGLMNPSIYLDNNSLILNLRHVNYTLHHSENNQLFINRWGPLSYLNPENDIHLRTTNWFCELNDDMSISKFKKIDTSLLDVEPIWEFVGLEDGRLVRWDNKLFLCGVRRDTTTNGEGRMELSELEVTNGYVKEISRHRIQPPIDYKSYCEKNWMPILDLPFHFVKWCNPTEVVKVDIETNTSLTIIQKSPFGNVQNMRGGSQVITYKNKRICIIHNVDLFNNRLSQKDAKYTHRFVVWDMDWNIEYISDNFSFLGGEIEFCTGLAEYKEYFLITFGFQDNAAYMLKMPKKYIDNFVINKCDDYK